MTEGLGKQNEQYRHFAKAAKQEGLDSDVRKLAALDSNYLLEGTSEGLRSEVSATALTSFFRTLEGDSTANDKDVLAIGNFLYAHRADKGEGRSLEESDKKIMNLGCALVENSFYNGTLLGLSQEQGAATAFTVNVLAKIFENPATAEGLNGFNTSKLSAFVEAVHAFEQRSLFPDVNAGEGGQTACGAAIDEIQKEIKEKARLANAERPEEGWEQYFRDAAGELRAASKLLEEIEPALNDANYPHLVQYRGYETARTIADAADFLEAEATRVANSYESRLFPLRTSAENASDVSGRFYSAYYFSEKESLLDAAIRVTDAKSGILGDRFELISRTGLDNAINRLRKLAEETTLAPDKKIKNFVVAGDTLRFRELPAAIETINRILRKPISGSFGRYLSGYDEVAKLVNRRKDVRIQDTLFMVGEERGRRFIDKPYALPYLIKNSLIVDNMVGPKADKSYENQLLRMDFPTDIRETIERGARPSHYFLGRNSSYDNTRSTAYADLHFIPEDIPFALWTNRYLRSQKGAQ